MVERGQTLNLTEILKIIIILVNRNDGIRCERFVFVGCAARIVW